jgi:uncharacterized repeat protein (TIGR03803 family)
MAYANYSTYLLCETYKLRLPYLVQPSTLRLYPNQFYMKHLFNTLFFFFACTCLLQAQSPLYGSVLQGGTTGRGVLISFDRSANTSTVLHNFSGVDGDGPQGRLVQGYNSLFYGITGGGGSNSSGVLFSLNPVTNVFTKLYDFVPATGALPTNGLLLASNGLLYGSTQMGGSERGVLYSFDPATSTYTKLLDFAGSNGTGDGGSLMQASNGKIYGVTSRGGSGYKFPISDDYGKGVLFSFDIATSTYTIHHEFGIDSGFESSKLMQASNGLLYAVTAAGGSNGLGVLYSFDPAKNTYTVLHNFTRTDGQGPVSTLVQARNGLLYGATVGDPFGFTGWYGTLFSYNIASNSFTKLYSFNGVDGGRPRGDLLLASEGKLYGLTTVGGVGFVQDRFYGDGVVFSYDIASNTYMRRLDFTGGNGSFPVGSTFAELAVTTTCTTPPTFKNDGTIVLDASCGKSDGNISIIPTSGTYPFMYSIDGGLTYVSNQYPGYTFNNLAPGTYKLRLKDARGCESAIVQKTLIARYNPPTFKNDGTIVRDASCARNDGNISIIPTSGTPRFWYSINGGATYVTNDYVGYTFNNLVPGNYMLRLKDATGCESETIEREVKLNCTSNCTPPTFVNNGLIILDATCANNDGNINIIPTSGTAPFMYSINGGVTYVAGPNAGYGFQNLPSGTYKLRLKDANGCESAIVERVVRLICSTTCTLPTFVNNGLIVLDASCGKSDGNINIIPTSGTAPFMYSINGGTTYVVGPNAGYGFQNLPAGTYQLRLKDARGCESAIVERTVRNYYNCPGTVSTNTFETPLALSNKDVIATYPNPNNGQFKLLLQNFQAPKAEASVYDAKGTLIQKRSLNLTQNTIADFDIKGKAAGLYYIKVVSSNGTRIQKLVVQ